VVAVLPETYIPEPMNRLDFYQRMAQANADEAIFDVFEEIEDRYGRAPEEAQHFAEMMVIRRRLKALGVTALSAGLEERTIKLGLTFVPQPPIDSGELTRRLQLEPDRYRLLPSGRLVVTVVARAEPGPMELLRTVRDEIGALPARDRQPNSERSSS
jgi:transcription-repair coupling factor (superfamily II helicase)